MVIQHQAIKDKYRRAVKYRTSVYFREVAYTTHKSKDNSMSI